MPQAETRAEFAERTVAKLEKSIDDLEGTSFSTYLSLVMLFDTGQVIILFQKITHSITHIKMDEHPEYSRSEERRVGKECVST